MCFLFFVSDQYFLDSKGHEGAYLDWFFFVDLRGFFVFFVTLAGLPDRSKRQSHGGAEEREVFARCYAALSLVRLKLTALGRG